MRKKIIWLWAVFMLVAAPGTAAAKLAPDDFIDIQGHWAQPEIQAVCSQGLMNGTGTNAQGFKIFAPQTQLSRSQLASVLVSAFQLDYGPTKFVKQPSAGDYYQDIDNKAWYADAVVMCAINKIFDDNDCFYPDRTVTRIELARAIQHSFNARGINLPMIMVMPYYQDTGDLSQQEMNALVFVSNTGIMKGDGGKFRPGEAVSRAELARVINRCANLMEVNENYHGQEYKLSVGQTLAVSLDSNPTTGYKWSFASPYDQKILTLLGETYQTTGKSEQALLGQGGRNCWKFKALQAGTTDLQLVYSRPWENTAPLQTFNLKVTVTSSTVNQNLVTISCKEVKSQSELIDVNLNIPVINGLADQQLQSKLNAKLEKDALDLHAQLAAEVEDYAKECRQQGYPIRPYEIVTRYQECYNQNGLLSLYVDYYQYTGGAHGSTDRRAYNIDLKTGQELALKDLFQENGNYKEMINQKIRQQISAEPDPYFTEPNMGFKTIADNQSFYLQEGNLVIYFGQYEIAPYASGIPEFKIPFSL